MGGSASFLSAEQEDALKAFVGATLPRSTRQVGAFIEQEFGLVYESRSGLIALLHRLGLEYHKPDIIPRKLNKEKQQAFIESYDNLFEFLGRQRSRAVRGRGASDPCGAACRLLGTKTREARDRTNERARADQYSRRDRSRDRPDPDDRGRNCRRRLDDQAPGIDRGALSDVGAHPCLSRQRALSSRQLVQEWLARPGCRIKLHFIPSYCPHLNPIERLWGLMHRNVTHNKCYATCAQFADATLGFLRETVPRNWADFCDSVTDNFRVINPKDFRVMT